MANDPSSHGNGNGNSVTPDKIRLDIHWTIKLLGAALIASGLFYTTTAGFRNDISSIRAQMALESQQKEASKIFDAEHQLRLKVEEELAKVISERDALKTKLEDERQKAIADAIDGMTRRVELQQYEQGRLKEALSGNGIKLKDE